MADTKRYTYCTVSAVSGRYLGQDPDLCNVRDIYHPVCAILHDELVDFPNEDEAECAYVFMVKWLSGNRKLILELRSVTCHMGLRKCYLPSDTGISGGSRNRE